MVNLGVGGMTRLMAWIRTLLAISLLAGIPALVITLVKVPRLMLAAAFGLFASTEHLQ